MKITCVLGSPRQNGNSTLMARAFLDTAAGLGADITLYTLNDMTVRGCQGCMACKTTIDHCVIRDDLTQVLESLASTDVLLLASPIYYGNVSSQLKAFIDRSYSLLVPDYMTNPRPHRLPDGKQMVMFLTQGYPDENSFNDVFPQYDFFYQWHGFKPNHLLRACGVGRAGHVTDMPEILQSARDLAKKLCSG